LCVQIVLIPSKSPAIWKGNKGFVLACKESSVVTAVTPPLQQQPQQPYPPQQQQPTSNIGIETALQNMNTKDKDYYREQFHTFNNSTGFQASFNIYAFFFSAFWYLHHKMWGKALVLFAVSLLTGGFAAPLIWIYGGMAGNYDLHLKYVQRKDWW